MFALTASIALYFSVLACIRIAKCWGKKKEAFVPEPLILEPNLEALEAARDGPVPVEVELVRLPTMKIPEFVLSPKPEPKPRKSQTPSQPTLRQVEMAQDILRGAIEEFHDRIDGLERQLGAMDVQRPERGIVRIFCPNCRAILIFDEIRRGEWPYFYCVTSLCLSFSNSLFSPFVFYFNIVFRS